MHLHKRKITLPVFWLLLILVWTNTSVSAEDDYRDRIAPFIANYCTECHNAKKARGDLDFTGYSQSSHVIDHFRKWKHIVEFIQNGEMPPEDEKKQPSLDERQSVVKAIQSILLAEAKKNAGDPGQVLPRRLSGTEYDLSIRDLTGIDIRPTRDFPPDPAGGEGFDNTHEALTMSPSLLKKYMGAAQEVSNHLVLTTEGVVFAPFPVTTYNEKKKLTEQAIVDFYRKHDVRLLDYLEAAWRYRFRDKTERDVTIEQWATRTEISGSYLKIVWQTLEESKSSVGFLKTLIEKWQAVPPPTTQGDLPNELKELPELVEFYKRLLYESNDNLIRPNAGTWPIGHLDFRAKKAAERDQFVQAHFHREYKRPRSNTPHVLFDRIPKAKQPSNDENTPEVKLVLYIEPAFKEASGNFVVLNRPAFSKNGNLPRNWLDPDSLSKESDLKRFQEEVDKQKVVSLRAFLRTHAPDVAERLRFGHHPKGTATHADSLVVEAPTRIEIPLTAKLAEQLRESDLRLVIPCKLDREHGKEGAVYVWNSIERVEHEKSATQNQKNSQRPQDNRPPNHASLLIDPESVLAKSMAESLERFCFAFPNDFYYVHPSRGLAAGFHLVEGFFRDDQPLVNKVLNPQQQKELDRLWRELHFVTNSVENLLRGFVWFERSERERIQGKEFDFLRAEDPQLVEPEMLKRFETVYSRQVSGGEIVQKFFGEVREGLALRKAQLVKAETLGMDNLQALAQRAYRRPLSPDEQASLSNLYRKLREGGREPEQALRSVLVAILMSPEFSYVYTETPQGKKTYKLSDYALASRLSYFLWSSLPDEELLNTARDGKLQDESALLAQTRRMLKDDRVNAFAREFFGQWLRFRDYLQKDPVDGNAFREYDEQLRVAMFEEPTRLATWLIQQDRPVISLLNSNETFVNRTLADHYGGEIQRRYRESGGGNNSQDEWQRVVGLKSIGRGGLFGMAVILTKNSSGRRTSPIKRGFWTVHHLLGKHFPPPPADVPELPSDEKLATKTIRELIADHTADAKCAMCHTHFDSIGLAMEGFDPIGKARTRDLAGRTIDNVAELPDGKLARGIPQLIEYIEKNRQEEFLDTLCRKFLGYALGRSVLLSDQPLIETMKAKLKANEYRFSALFETVVTSRQFREQRGSDYNK